MVARALGGKIGKNLSGRFVLTGESHLSTACLLVPGQLPQLSLWSMSWISCHSADALHSAVEELSLQAALRKKRYFKAAGQAGDHPLEAWQQLKVLESHGDQVLILPGTMTPLS